MFRMKTIAMLALVALIAVPAMADTKEYRIMNNSGSTVSGLSIPFTGLGVTSSRLLTSPDSCPTTTSTNVGDTVSVAYGTNCMVDKDILILRVKATGSLPTNTVPVAGAQWTIQAGSPVALTSGDAVHLTGGVPTVSQWGLIVMTLLLLTAATIIFARRRPATAHA